jgi:pilus assembly protein Flp/PilA
MLREYFEDESGVTMIEYGLIAGLIGVALIVVLTTLGDTMESVLYGNISSSLKSATP